MQESNAETPTASADLDLIREAASEAARIAMTFFCKAPEVWMKEGSSPVSEADYAVDRFLREELTSARPGYGWLSEETADSPERLGAKRTFVVDPIDGTRAFLDRRKTWCVSIAVVEDGVPIAGVLDCPALEEIYWAAQTGPAYQNGSTISVRESLERPEVGGPKSIFNMLPDGLRDRVATTSYIPSLAYRIALLARGSLDAALVKPNSHDWDLAAADLILRQAGGRVVDEFGRNLTYAGAEVKHDMLVAGSDPLLSEILEALASRDGRPVSNAPGMI
ncbi:3'(2'),5'-bisphosphate nucleotidase CysQ [Aquibium oceanicum]|uniref:3'(2'),5'-bisphosphate nucleotidase CysQ n=1 Tax=Aquibium oceanicum TaxID=1670800 RepID=A0A1L3SV79_9HYPH|nr:3'(2'),5'-bisphosphate nucleotidase CysQ [Aquibium oceanicum]APH73225.1 3'(2'),5'-bisphosphate nucleotidase CysQ [Aquibium oceanicum]